LTGWCSEAVVTSLVTGGHLCQRLLTLTVILKLPYWGIPHADIRSCDRIANLQGRYAQKELNALLVENDIDLTNLINLSTAPSVKMNLQYGNGSGIVLP